MVLYSVIHAIDESDQFIAKNTNGNRVLLILPPLYHFIIPYSSENNFIKFVHALIYLIVLNFTGNLLIPMINIKYLLYIFGHIQKCYQSQPMRSILNARPFFLLIVLHVHLHETLTPVNARFYSPSWNHYSLSCLQRLQLMVPSSTKHSNR